MEISWGTERTGWRPYHPWSLFDQPAAAISLCSSPITNVDFCIWKEYFPKDRRPIFRSGGCNLWDILLLGSATKLGRSGYLLAYGKLGTDERSALLYPQLSTSATQSKATPGLKLNLPPFVPFAGCLLFFIQSGGRPKWKPPGFFFRLLQGVQK